MAWKHDGHFAQVAVQYAIDVINGDIDACLQIRQQCQIFLNDVEGEKWVYNANLVERACLFLQALPHVKGKWASRRETLVLEPWQVWMTAAIIGLVDQQGKRKHREALCLIPRKNAKSTWAAGIALYLLVADGEAGAEIFIGANSEKQADACFLPARDMARRAVGFAETFGVEAASRSVFLADGSFIKPMIGKPGDGSNPHCAILDEAHENDTSDQYDTMKTGMGSREQPFLLTITTAGTNLAGPCRELQVQAEQVLAGNVQDERLFAAIYTIDKEDDWKDFAVWRKANPNFGVSVSEEYLLDQYTTALRSPSKQSIVRTKHLNQWVSSSSAHLNMKDWADCGTAPPLEELIASQGVDRLRAWIGLDLATKTDVAAIALLVAWEGKLLLYPFLFLPEGAIEGSKNETAYRTWCDAGHIIRTDGNALDFQVVEDKARELIGQLDVQNIGFDPWQGHNLAQRLMLDGKTVTEYGQKYQTMHRPMDDLEARLAEKTLLHPNNPALNWMAGNLCARYSGEFKRPDKPDRQPHLKIDGMVAAIMALGLSIVEEDPTPEFYIAFGD